MATINTRKLAVVTGASSGIGFHLAQECARNGFDLIICAEDDAIHGAATELVADGTLVEPVQADLSTPEGVERLVTAVKASLRPVDAILLNAGIGAAGRFLETSIVDDLRQISLNCAAVVYLAKMLVPDMVARKQGRVLITASIASTTPVPYNAVYGATKAFDLSFAEALRYELKDTGVTVTALQPGPTDTAFFARARMEDTKVATDKKDDPADVAAAGFAAMMKGEDSVIAASLKTKLMGAANEVLPETTKAGIQARYHEPGSGKRD
ncbi:MAG: SDR family NAD(P)-dependent oxidoreductase [Kofleriaceae bacterium]|nr:MAG: SDR family NAD(P)-dependent oxidoreductase [Kofleriaceae bacterium]MBZ0231965.1 SDR family NAD(P)-dependent oxidoreductase [Kofleriaceae bacterium]